VGEKADFLPQQSAYEADASRKCFMMKNSNLIQRRAICIRGWRALTASTRGAETRVGHFTAISFSDGILVVLVRLVCAAACKYSPMALQKQPENMAKKKLLLVAVFHSHRGSPEKAN
jgi:hypothetical protein